ncbi:MAG: hypothetical protein AAFO94_01090 [Bacteroidota bacterium]
MQQTALKIESKHLWILQIAVAALFFGRAWQHLVWDAPYRSLLWDQAWMEGIILRLTGLPWEQYITSMEVDDGIRTFVKCVGAFYVLCGTIALLIRQNRRWMHWVLYLGSGSLLFLSFLYFKEKFFVPAQFFEYSLQWSAPLFLLYSVRYGSLSRRAAFALRLAIAFTFTAHGLYALNVFPRPGIFMEMTMNILGVSETDAVRFLNLAGVLDLVLSVFIFFRGNLAKAALAYACFWGLATALARVWAFFDWSQAGATLSQWLHETVMRSPHFLLPLLLLLLLLQWPYDRLKPEATEE